MNKFIRVLSKALLVGDGNAFSHVHLSFCLVAGSPPYKAPVLSLPVQGLGPVPTCIIAKAGVGIRGL